MKDGRRCTATLTLVLIGAAALHGCGGDNNEQATRDVYRTRADCQRDWGDDPKKCEPQSSGRHSGHYYGPMYGAGRMGSSFSSGDSAAPPRQGSNAVSSTTVTRSGGTSSSGGGSTARGGFGSSASAHSSGG